MVTDRLAKPIEIKFSCVVSSQQVPGHTGQVNGLGGGDGGLESSPLWGAAVPLVWGQRGNAMDQTSKHIPTLTPNSDRRVTLPPPQLSAPPPNI